MAELTASRTLVKSSPELWAECSDAASLARHLGAFGEIRITRLEPETAVAWEGEDVRGTVTLEPSGWGTRVVLTAQTSTDAEEPAPVTPVAPPPAVEVPAIEAGTAEAETAEAEAETVQATTEDVPEQLADDAHDEPEAIEPGPGPRRGLFGRLFGFWRRPAPDELNPVDPGEPAPAVKGRTPQADEGRAPQNAVAAEETPAAAEAARAPHNAVTAEEAPAAAEEVPAHVQAPADDRPPPSEVLVGALDSLGQAHRRPFARS